MVPNTSTPPSVLSAASVAAASVVAAAVSATLLSVAWVLSFVVESEPQPVSIAVLITVASNIAIAFFIIFSSCLFIREPSSPKL